MKATLLPMLALTVAFTTTTALPADAAVVCQRGNKVKLRVACKRKETTLTDLGSDVSGIWRHSEGEGLASGDSLASFLTLNADGTGELDRRDPTTQQVSCSELRYAYGSGTPVLTLHPRGGSLSVVQVALDRTLGGNDVLRIVDDRGTAVFERAAAVDATASCGTLVETVRLTGLPAPSQGRTGLAFDGTSFLYTQDDNEPVAIDRTTGAVGAPFSLHSSAQYLHASEGDDLWGDCFCGNGAVAGRTSRTGVQVDVVDTAALGAQTIISGLAVPTPGELFVYGSKQIGNRSTGRLLRVNTAAEPYELISDITAPQSVRGVAFADGRLWGLIRSTPSVLLRIDPTTGLALRSLQVLDTTVTWSAVAATDGAIFLLGSDRDGLGVVATFETPAD